MMAFCPQCGSQRTATRDRARKVAAALGGLAGALSRVPTSTWGDARLGPRWIALAAQLAVIAAPAAPLSAIARAAMAALFGATAGCAAGAALGALIDDKVLDNYCCLACGFRFSRFTSPESEMGATTAPFHPDTTWRDDD